MADPEGGGFQEIPFGIQLTLSPKTTESSSEIALIIPESEHTQKKLGGGTNAFLCVTLKLWRGESALFWWWVISGNLPPKSCVCHWELLFTTYIHFLLRPLSPGPQAVEICKYAHFTVLPKILLIYVHHYNIITAIGVYHHRLSSQFPQKINPKMEWAQCSPFLVRRSLTLWCPHSRRASVGPVYCSHGTKVACGHIMSPLTSWLDPSNANIHCSWLCWCWMEGRILSSNLWKGNAIYKPFSQCSPQLVLDEARQETFPRFYGIRWF